jgi:hypothetical protein
MVTAICDVDHERAFMAFFFSASWGSACLSSPKFCLLLVPKVYGDGGKVTEEKFTPAELGFRMSSMRKMTDSRLAHFIVQSAHTQAREVPKATLPYCSTENPALNKSIWPIEGSERNLSGCGDNFAGV